MQLPILDTKDIIIILGILGLLAGASVWFNAYIDREADQEPLGPNTGMYVVMGITYVTLGGVTIFSILFDFEMAAWFAIVTFLCLMFAGVPMLFGAQKRGRMLRKRFKQQSQNNDGN